MRFSRSRKFIYLANPKTGSTSIRNLLDDISDHQQLIDLGLYHEHWSACQYKIAFRKLGWSWDEHYRFLTIRDPWKKFVSNYVYSRPDRLYRPFYHPQYHPDSRFQHDFRSWLLHYMCDMNRFPPGCPSLSRFAWHKGVCLVDDIFPIETFAEKALPKLKQRLSLPDDAELKCLNGTAKSQDYLAYYDDETIELVADACRLDIEIGGYQLPMALAAGAI